MLLFLMIKPITKIQYSDIIKTKKQLEKECMNLWQKIVKLRAGNKCEFPCCNKTEYLNAHHIYSRSRRSVRYDIDNGICLCAGHHSLNNDSAHKNPDFKETIIKNKVRTKNFWDILERKAKIPAKLDLKLELLYLKNELKKYDKMS